MSLLAGIDYLSSTSASVWHRASALSKLALVAGIIGLSIFTPSLTLLAAVHVLAWGLLITARIPRRLILLAAAYPFAFCLFFIAATWDGSWITPLKLLMRPLTACFAAVWLVGTTPYPDLFAPISRIMPRNIGDGLFLTYRALFELIGRAERLWRAMRIRGGSAGRPRQRVTLVGEGVGTLVLHGFERSQRLYAAMVLRGHSGRICGCRHYAEMNRADLVVGLAGVLLAAVSVALWGRP